MFEPLKSLSHFTIERVLGRGGMGIVYLARDENLARQVALKILDSYELPDAEKKTRFVHEARAAASIRHPNIATIYEVGETVEGMPFIAMEYCEGATLSQLLRRSTVGGGKFLKIARQIAEGVAAAHRNGVVHRDIKSANIVLQDDETVKILDFGLAKRFESNVSRTAQQTTGSSFFGTLPYISPEQAEGKHADQRSDLFSVGVVLYELATGKLPFDDESPLIVLEKIRDAEPAPFEPSDPTFPAAASSIVSKLLQKDPDDRYQTAEQLIADLSMVERVQTITGPTQPLSRTSSTKQFGKTVRRHLPSKSAWFALAAAALIVVSIAIGVLVTQRRAAPPVATTTSSSGPIRSLAVLPFRNVSGAQADDFLSVGLADALVTRLQQSSDLKIRPTSAIMSYQKSPTIDPKVAGSQLQVEGVLEGHFLTSGNVIRVNLQLTDARTGYSVWASSVDGSRGDLIRLIDNVSNRTSTGIAEKLATPVVQKEGSEPHTNNPEAYEAYLQARALNASFLPGQTEQQIGHLRRAVDLDPTFAAAYADLAIALSLQKVRGFANDDPNLKDPVWYARQAVRLDPNLADAHLALGRTLVRVPDRFRESVRENLAALRLKPNDTQALDTVATYFISSGEPTKAECIGDLLVALDPNANLVRTRGFWNVNAIDPEGSLRMARIALSHPETELPGHDISGQAYLMIGDIAKAEEERKAIARLVPDHYFGKSLKAMIAASKGDRAATEAALASFKKDAETNHWAAVRYVLCYAKLGDRDKALEWLHKAVQLGNHSWYYFVRHPWLKNLQTDAEYQEVLSKMKTDLDDVRDDVVGVYQLICRDQRPTV